MTAPVNTLSSSFKGELSLPELATNAEASKTQTLDHVKRPSLLISNEGNGGRSSQSSYAELALPKEEVNLADAKEAFTSVFTAILHKALGGLVDDKKVSAKEVPAKTAGASLEAFESMPIDFVQRAVTQMVFTASSAIAKSKTDLAKILTDAQEKVRAQQVKQIEDQQTAAAEDAKKAKKAGIISVFVDFAVSAVEVISGGLKVVGGFFSGNPLMMAGGAAEFLAGVAGMGKVICNTILLFDPNNETAKTWAGRFGVAQLTLEIITLALTAVSVCLLVKEAGKTAATAATKAMEGAAGAGLKDAAKTGSKEAIKGASQAVAKEIAQDIGKEFAENIAKKAAGNYGARLGRKLGEELTQQIIAEAIEASVKATAKEAAKKGAEVAAEAVTKAVVEEVVGVVKWKVAEMTLGTFSGLTASAFTRAAAKQVIEGGAVNAIQYSRAELQEQIKELMAKEEFSAQLFQMLSQIKKETEEVLKTASETITKAAEIQTDSTNRSASLAATIVSNIA